MTATRVLLHGFTGAPMSFEALGLNGARALAIAGHRGAPLPAADFRAEVTRLAAAISPGTHLIGYSLGARLALGVLLEHPERVARATLIGVHPGLREAAARQVRARADAHWIRMLETEGIERFVDAWQALPMWDSQRALPAATLARQRALRLDHDALGLAACLRVLGLAAMPDYGARLDEIAAPVQLVVGEHDAKFRALADELRLHIRDARLDVVPGCGHNPLLERPAHVAALLRDFDAAAELAVARAPQGLATASRDRETP